MKINKTMLIFSILFISIINLSNITKNKAIEIALKNSKNGILKDIEYEAYKKNPIWEVEIWDEEGTKEFKINSKTGKFYISSIDFDDMDENPVKNSNFKFENRKMKTEKEIFDIVKKEFPNGNIIEISLKSKHGFNIFEVEIILNNDDVEVEIDAFTGKIIKIDY